MLKIKDNVDLKEFENFGFVLRYSEIDGQVDRLVQEWGYPYIDSKKRPFIKFIKRKRKIYFCKIPIWHKRFDYCFEGRYVIPNHSSNREFFFDTLYDLIKAGLVEKV